MFKGLVALFTSGAIFNPMVLLGVALGIFAMIKLDAEAIRSLALDYHLYLLALLISAAYVFVFKRIYKEGGINLDYAAMAFASVAGVLKFALAFVLTLSFIVLVSF